MFFYFHVVGVYSVFVSATTSSRQPSYDLVDRFYVLPLPHFGDPNYPGLHLYKECEYFGFQYSMEWYFIEAFRLNPSLVASDWRYADFIFVPHCVSLIYFALRGSGMAHYDALHRAEREYLIPIITHALSHPAFEISQGKNFFMVLSMDKGRQDFPTASALIANWSIGALTYSNHWLEDNSYYFGNATAIVEGPGPHGDPLRLSQVQDFVISIPSRFPTLNTTTSIKSPRSGPRSSMLFYFAGSMNSKERRQLLHTWQNSNTSNGIYVTNRFSVDDTEYSRHMRSSRFCGVLPGSSHTNNVRLYDAIAHGCIPVVISNDFTPVLHDTLPWKEAAIFLRPEDIPSLYSILASISHERERQMREKLLSQVAPYLDWNTGAFWTEIFRHITRKVAMHTAHQQQPGEEVDLCSDSKDLTTPLDPRRLALSLVMLLTKRLYKSSKPDPMVVVDANLVNTPGHVVDEDNSTFMSALVQSIVASHASLHSPNRAVIMVSVEPNPFRFNSERQLYDLPGVITLPLNALLQPLSSHYPLANDQLTGPPRLSLADILYKAVLPAMTFASIRHSANTAPITLLRLRGAVDSEVPKELVAEAIRSNARALIVVEGHLGHMDRYLIARHAYATGGYRCLYSEEPLGKLCPVALSPQDGVVTPKNVLLLCMPGSNPHDIQYLLDAIGS